MDFMYQSLMRANDPASVLALVREFNYEARNILMHLRALETACEKDLSETSV